MSKLSDARAKMRDFLTDMAALKPFADLDQRNELNEAFALARIEAKKAAVEYVEAIKAQ